MDYHPQVLPGPFNFYLGNPGMKELVFQRPPDHDVLKQLVAVTLACVPSGIPGLDNTEPISYWMCLLPQINLLLSFL
jgi:hypothetical protein